jgi:hypothetical protein
MTEANQVTGYVEFPERPGLPGLQDKIAVMSAIAWKHAEGDQPFRDHVLAIVAGAGQAADAQFRAWEQHCKGLLYRREPGEIVRSPEDVAATGGDCDDLAIYCCAGLRSLQIPCLLQILADEAGNGYHIRCLVGLPPIDPSVWVICDPSADQETTWAMDGKTQIDPALDGSLTLTWYTEPQEFPTHPLIWVAAGVAGTLFAQWLIRKMQTA